MFLFPLHSSVLKPDLDLALSQAERMRDLDPAPAREVAVEVELFFQLQDLMACVSRPVPLAVVQVGSVTC